MVALTTLGEDKPVMVNLDQVAMMQDTGDKTVLHFNGQQGEGQFVWTVSETVNKINVLRPETAQVQGLPGYDLYMKGILTLIALALLANVISYMYQLPSTILYALFTTNKLSILVLRPAHDGRQNGFLVKSSSILL
jgi:hypothetical protein